MSTDFNFYEGTASENTAPKITVRKGGQLVLTKGAVEMLGEGVTAVQIGYNVKTKVVGIRGAAENAMGRYRLRSQKNSGSRLVTGKRFFTHNGLTIEKAKTFDAEAYDGGIVGFQLTEEPAEAEAEIPTPAETTPAETTPAKKTAPAKKTGGRRKARAAA